MGYGSSNATSKPMLLSDVVADKQPRRLSTGLIDEVLGGGLVEDGVVFLVGPPGIGKSTLSLQIASSLSVSNLKVLYVAGEESPEQVKQRANRLGIDCNNLYLVSDCHLERVTDHIEELRPDVFIVDSLQTMNSSAYRSSPGSPTQMKRAAQELTNLSKSMGCASLLLGHVVKSGGAAGPKTVEHIVDAVVYFRGKEELRILKASKNRFGSTDEVLILKMDSKGLSKHTPSNTQVEVEPGIIFTAYDDGKSVRTVPVQTILTFTDEKPSVRCNFYTSKEMEKVLTCLRSSGIPLGHQDVMSSILGHNDNVKDPSVELAITLSIIGSYFGYKSSDRIMAIGGITLTGGVLCIENEEEKINLAMKLGFRKIITGRSFSRYGSSIVHPVDSIVEAVQVAFK